MKPLLTFFLLTTSLFAGDIARIGPSLPIFPQSAAAGYDNSIGFSNIVIASISEISSSNPSSLSNFSSSSFGFNIEYSSTLELFDDITINRPKQWLPASFGFVYPYNNCRLGLTYHQKYYNLLDFGEIPITTVEHPEGTGETFSATSETSIHSVSGIFAYSIEGIFNDEDQLSLGGQLFGDFLFGKEKIYKSEGTVEGNDISWKLGVLYKLSDQLGIGLFYEKGIDIEGTFQMDSDTKLVEKQDSILIATIPPSSYNIKLPDKFSFGLSGKPINNLTLSITISSIFWNSLYDDFNNQLDVSVGAIYALSDFFALSLGVYDTDLNRKETTYFGMYSDLDATFIGAGIKVRLKTLDVRLEVNDSHLFSAERREQTQIKLGFDYSLR